MAGGKAAADRFGGLDRAVVGKGFGDAGLERFVEQGLLTIARSPARTTSLTEAVRPDLTRSRAAAVSGPSEPRVPIESEGK